MANQSKFARPKEPNAAAQQQAIQHFMQLIHQQMQLKQDDANARILSRGTVKQVKQLLDKGFDVNKPMGLPECWFTPLAMALINKHKRVARLLIERGADVNAQAYSMLHVPTGDISHLTALSFAIIGGFEDKAKVLVKCGADVNAVTLTVIRRNGTYIHQKPLGFALTQGKLTLARYLIANGASMKAPCIEFTEETGKAVCSALFLNPGFCLQNGAQITEVTEYQRGGFVYTCTMMGLGLLHRNKEIVQHLLQNDVDVNQPAITIASDKMTLIFPPLAWAMLARLHTIIPLLHGADNKMLITTDPIGFSIPPLALAVSTGSNEAIRELIQLGVNVNEGVIFRENEMEACITTLGWAIFNEQTLMACLLLMNGADPNKYFIDYKGNDNGIVFITPLMIALMNCNSILTAALIKKKAKANTTGMTIQHNSKEGMVSISLPHLFGTAESAEFAKVLLEHGCDIDAPLEIKIKDKVWPITPLALAASTDRIDIVEFLLENGANVDHQDAFIGISALVFATFAGQQQNMELLLKYKADVNQVGRVTALTAACIIANSEAVRVLLEHGANVDLTDSQGKSPLISAVQTTNDKGGVLKKKDVKGTVELLFEYKAEVDLRRALELAREEGLTEIAALIAEHTGTSDTPPQAENKPTHTEAGANTELIMQFMRIVTNVQDTLCNFESKVCSRFDKIEDKITTLTNAVDLLTPAAGQGVLQPQGEPEVTSPKASVSSSSTQQEDPAPPDLADAHKILKQLASEWENIGMYLRIPDDEIKAIKKEQLNNSKDCLRELLRMWLRGVAPPTTWRALAEAVGEVNERVAREITDKHIH